MVTVDGRFNHPGQSTKQIRQAFGSNANSPQIEISEEEDLTNY
jgi:hypothetical protein